MVNNMLYAKYVYEDYGYESDQQNCREYLTLGEVYEVGVVEMGQSHTDIELIGYPCMFNSVNFVFFKKSEDTGDLIEHDIFNDPECNPYLRR